MKTFISQNINKIKLAPFPESIVLVATCTYHEGNDEFHAILQLVMQVLTHVYRTL